jgi:hypothetical protein
VQIGISEGMMRVGTQGSLTRHRYDAAGDDVNLAARLMSQAARGLAIIGMRKRHPAWSLNFQQSADSSIKGWKLDDAAIDSGLAQGAAMDFDVTVEEIANELSTAAGMAI